MVRTSIKYAILCGVFLIVLFWVSVKVGSNPHLDIRHLLFDIVIFFLFIYFAAREFKIYHNDGYLHYWQGMTIAVIVYLPAAVIFTLSLILMFQMDSSIMEEYREGLLASLESQRESLLEGMSLEEFEKRKAEVPSITSGDLIISSGLKKVLTGLFVTPVVSILLRKKPK